MTVADPDGLWPQFTHPRTHSLSHTHTYTFSRTLSLSLAHTLSHTLSLCFTHTTPQVEEYMTVADPDGLWPQFVDPAGFVLEPETLTLNPQP